MSSGYSGMAGIARQILHATPAKLKLGPLSIAGILCEIVSKLPVRIDIGPRSKPSNWRYSPRKPLYP